MVALKNASRPVKLAPVNASEPAAGNRLGLVIVNGAVNLISAAFVYVLHPSYSALVLIAAAVNVADVKPDTLYGSATA